MVELWHVLHLLLQWRRRKRLRALRCWWNRYVGSWVVDAFPFRIGFVGGAEFFEVDLLLGHENDTAT